MGIYVNNALVYVTSGSAINTQVTMTAGAQHTVVEEWEKCGGAAYTTVNITAQVPAPPTVSLTANPISIAAGASSVLTAKATNATQVVVTGSDGSSYPLAASGGTKTVTPAVTTTYTVEATGTKGTASDPLLSK